MNYEFIVQLAVDWEMKMAIADGAKLLAAYSEYWMQAAVEGWEIEVAAV
jgi:hypothetical protein